MKENTQEIHRKIRAIMFSDMQGYSRKMGQDEVASMRLLETHNSILVPIIQRHGGEVLKFIGDAILASFESATDAVLSAVEIQKRLKERNRHKREKERIVIRIGIHVGDVMLKGGDAFGDGVNIASRIEPLAEPGGICVSQAVHDMVKAISQIKMAPMGAKRLKNIEEPVHIYRVAVSPKRRRDAAWPALKSLAASRLTWGALAVLAAGAIVLAVRWKAFAPGSGGFSIAVTPFWGESKEASEEGKVMQALVGRRLHEELKDEPEIKIDEKTSKVLRSHEEARAFGRKTKADVVLWGEVLTLRNEVEIQPYLTMVNREGGEPNKGAEAFRARLDEPKQLELRKAKAKELGNLALYIAGRYYLDNKRDFPKALDLFKRIDPPSAESLSGQGGVYVETKRWEEAERTLKEAILQRPKFTSPFNLLGNLYVRQGRYAEAVDAYRKVIALDPPRIAVTHNNLGYTYFLLGDLQSAEKELRTSIRLDPKSSFPVLNMGLVFLSRRKFPEAVAQYRKAAALSKANDPFPLTALGAAYLYQGELGRARKELEKAVAIRPRLAKLQRYLGLIDFLESNYAGAAKEFESALALAAQDADAGLFVDPFPRGLPRGVAFEAYDQLDYFLAMKKAGQEQEALRRMGEFAGSGAACLPGARWPLPIACFYAGRIPESELLRRAGGKEYAASGFAPCDVDYYLGASGARVYLEKARAACSRDRVQYLLALSQLRPSGLR